MNRIAKLSVLAATALSVWLPTATQAQGAGGGGGGGGGGGRGNFDPQEMRQRMMERYKEALEVKSDDEWKVIEPRIQKVSEARREVGMSGRGMGMFGPRPNRAGGADNAQADQGQSSRRRAGGFGGQQSVAAQELQKAIDSKASADQIKSKLAAYREDRKAKQTALEKAQEELKKVLSVRQEAVAVVYGLLD